MNRAFFSTYAITIILFSSPALALLPPQGEPACDPPDIRDVQSRAIQYAHLDPRDVAKWKQTARRSAWLPQLQLDYLHRATSEVDVDINDSVYVGNQSVVVGPEQGKYSRNAGTGNNVGVRAIWRLNELVFSRDQLNIAVEAREMHKVRQALLDDVNRHYARRIELAAEIEALKEKGQRRPRHAKLNAELFLKRVAMGQAEAALDGLTGGWFRQACRPAEAK